jgi:hypothetical protein
VNEAAPDLKTKAKAAWYEAKDAVNEAAPDLKTKAKAAWYEAKEAVNEAAPEVKEKVHVPGCDFLLLWGSFCGRQRMLGMRPRRPPATLHPA